MVKVTIPIRGKKLPSYGARVVMRVSNGRLIMQKWPRKRGRVTNLVTKGQNERFRQANMLAKYASGEDQWIAIELTKNSPLYPRDLLMSAMAGRLFEKLTIDGQEFTAVAIRDDISADLDVVAGKVKGTIMVRGTDVWEALVPGPTGTFLQSAGPADTPGWGAGGGSSAPSWTAQTLGAAASGSAFASKGNIVEMAETVTLHGIAAFGNVASGASYRSGAYEVNGSHVIQAITGLGAVLSPSAGNNQLLYSAFAAPAVLVAGTRYYLGFNRTDLLDTTPLTFNGLTSPGVWPALPIVPLAVYASLNGFARIAKKAPAVSDTVAIGTGSALWQRLLLTT